MGGAIPCFECLCVHTPRLRSTLAPLPPTHYLLWENLEKWRSRERQWGTKKEEVKDHHYAIYLHRTGKYNIFITLTKKYEDLISL